MVKIASTFDFGAASFTSRSALLSLIVCGFAFLSGLPVESHAAPIYVFKESDGTIRFTNKEPPAGTQAKVFTGRGNGFSFYHSSRGPRVRLFSERYEQIIAGACEINQLDPALLKAVIHTESAFNPGAVSPKGALGLMQLMPGTARDLGVTRPFLPEDNIHGGAKYLAGLLKRFEGNLPYALAAYNSGEQTVKKYRGIPPYQETRDYVRRVLALKDRYQFSAKG